MRIISSIEEPKTIDSVIRLLELTFEAERPPPRGVVHQELLLDMIKIVVVLIPIRHGENSGLFGQFLIPDL